MSENSVISERIMEIQKEIKDQCKIFHTFDKKVDRLDQESHHANQRIDQVEAKITQEYNNSNSRINKIEEKIEKELSEIKKNLDKIFISFNEYRVTSKIKQKIINLSCICVGSAITVLSSESTYKIMHKVFFEN